MIQKGDIVVDVGGIYDPQKDFFDSFDEICEVPLSSAGLVYKKYGPELIRKFYSKLDNKDIKPSDDDFDKFYRDIYYHFIIEIDPFDNGFRQYISNFYQQLNNKNITQFFKNNLSLGQIVSKMNNTDSSNDQIKILLASF